MHLQRNNAEKFWAIQKKGTKYLAVATHNKRESMPLVTVMRDILNLVKTKKELKKVLNEKKIKINHSEIRETNYPVCLFDVISLHDAKKNYRAILSEDKKMIFKEITDKEAETKIFKVINKRILAGEKIQLNLMHGKNITTNEKANIGDSLVFNLKENKIAKIIPMEKGRIAYVSKGKHIGKKGKIEEIIVRGDKKLAKMIPVDSDSKNKKINVWIKNIMVVE